MWKDKRIFFEIRTQCELYGYWYSSMNCMGALSGADWLSSCRTDIWTIHSFSSRAIDANENPVSNIPAIYSEKSFVWTTIYAYLVRLAIPPVSADIIFFCGGGYTRISKFHENFVVNKFYYIRKEFHIPLSILLVLLRISVKQRWRADLQCHQEVNSGNGFSGTKNLKSFMCFI